MDRLVVMKTLVAVAHCSSFSGAAGTLGISPSLVSRHVADLEKQVGARLVNRTARSISLTAAGTAYADFAERILAEIEDTDAEIAGRQAQAEGELAIISPKWIGSLDLGVAVADFIAAHPKIRVRLELGGISDRIYDFVDRGFDVAFHARDPRDSRVRVRRISELHFVLAASVDYLKRRGTPTTPAELAEHALITHTSDTSWVLEQGDQVARVKLLDSVVWTNAYLVIEQLVESGTGIGLLPRRPAQAALDAGSLVQVLPDWGVPARSLYAVHGPGGQTPERVKVFLDFMSDWFRQHDRS